MGMASTRLNILVNKVVQTLASHYIWQDKWVEYVSFARVDGL